MGARLDGRTALITGASEGMRLAMARRFAESDANVAMVSRSAETFEAGRQEIMSAIGWNKVKVEIVSCDVTDTDQIETMWQAVSKSFGDVDILVNNAGATANGPFLDCDDERWQADLDLKLFAAIRLGRLALPGMAARKWGRIINVLAGSAKAPGPGSAPTSVSRAVGMALTKVMAGEGAPENILVNALLVGLIKSGQHERRHQHQAPEKTYEEYMEGRGVGIPFGRVGEAEEFDNMACFLASDAGSYVTGCAINVDGGRSPVV